MFKQIALPYFLLSLLLALLFMGGLVYGAVSIPLESVIDILLGKDVGRPAWQNIILQSRFPQAVTALLAGASLATSGLLLQTLFRNPLAGPSILGIKIKRTRIAILFCTGLLTATTTAFCGPISFIGLAVPHIARLMLGSSNHKMLVPVTMLAGSCIALLCNILMVMPGTNNILPLNAVTPMLGAPVIIYVIVNRKNIQYFD